MIEPVGLLVMLGGLGALVLPLEIGIGLVILVSLLQAAAALVIPGAASILPGHAMLCFVAAKVALDPKCRSDFVIDWSPRSGSFWLVLTTAYGVMRAVFFPRLWAGLLDTYPIGTSESSELMSLAPRNGNLTQSLYLCASLIWYLILANFLRTPKNLRFVVLVLLAYGAANIGFAILDIVTTRTGTVYLMDFIRNGAYSILVYDLDGVGKRIVGSFTEASAFAGASVGVFCFAARLWLSNLYSRLSGTIAFVTLLLIVLSTSSTGLIALAIAIFGLYLGCVYRLAKHTATASDATAVVLIPLLGLILFALVSMSREWTEYFMTQANLLLFDKASSDSGMTRAALNHDAWRVFVETRTLGAGLGSLRAASFVFAALGAFGVIGSLLYAIFFAGLIRGVGRRKPSPRDNACAAGRCGCLGILVAASISALHTELGLVFFAFAALAYANRSLPAPSENTTVRIPRSTEPGSLVLSHRPLGASKLA